MKKVIVLMSTYNGEKYIREQLDSILNQKNIDVSILVRDDGSTDTTKDILDEYKLNGKLDWYSGENLRTAKSFLDLVIKAPITADYYAFSDQDDIWLENKLNRAVDLLEELDDKLPRLYCSDYQLVDTNLNILPDNNHVSTETFNAAIVSSCCTGCTTVFDRNLKEVLSKQMPDIVLMHDDWAHKVCLAVGGKVVFDKEKNILYRQHGNNVDGGIRTTSSRANKIIKRIKDKDRIRSKQLNEIMRIYGIEMPINNKEMLAKVVNYYNRSFLYRIMLIMNNGLKTPYRRLNRGFYVAILFKYF